jgi:DNA-binding IclR family transcriptional regulator
VEVLVAIALSADGLVNATDLQEEIGLAQSRVRAQLVTLAAAGLLATYPATGGKRWYQRNDSILWGASLALYEEWVG